MNRHPSNRGTLPTWTPEQDARLLDLVADDRLSFSQIGAQLGTTKGSAIGRFDRLRAHFGWQAA